MKFVGFDFTVIRVTLRAFTPHHCFMISTPRMETGAWKFSILELNDRGVLKYLAFDPNPTHICEGVPGVAFLYVVSGCMP